MTGDLSPRQLRALAERIRVHAGPLDVMMHVGKYVRAEVMLELAQALDELAAEDER